MASGDKRPLEEVVVEDTCSICHCKKQISLLHLLPIKEQERDAAKLRHELELMMQQLQELDRSTKIERVNSQHRLEKQTSVDCRLEREDSGVSQMSTSYDSLKRGLSSHHSRLDSQTSVDSGVGMSLRRNVSLTLPDQNSLDKVEEGGENVFISSKTRRKASVQTATSDEIGTLTETSPADENLKTCDGSAEEQNSRSSSPVTGIEDDSLPNEEVQTIQSPTSEETGSKTPTNPITTPLGEEVTSVAVSTNDKNPDEGMHIVVINDVEYVRVGQRMIPFVMKTNGKVLFFGSYDNTELHVILCTGDKCSSDVPEPPNTRVIRQDEIDNVSTNALLSIHFEEKVGFLPVFEAGPCKVNTLLHTIYPKPNTIHRTLVYRRSETAISKFNVHICGPGTQSPCHTLARLSIAFESAHQSH